MINLVYDIPLGDQWKLSLGGGIGAGNARIHWTDPSARGSSTMSRARTSRLEYQGIAGIAYSLSPDVDLFVDYRYRGNQNDAHLQHRPSPL